MSDDDEPFEQMITKAADELKAEVDRWVDVILQIIAERAETVTVNNIAGELEPAWREAMVELITTVYASVIVRALEACERGTIQ